MANVHILCETRRLPTAQRNVACYLNGVIDNRSNYYEFLTLPMEIQAALVWKYGVFLERIAEDSQSFWLYSVYGFYVELVMANEENDVADVKPFMNAQPLEKYLGNIDWKVLLAA